MNTIIEKCLEKKFVDNYKKEYVKTCNLSPEDILGLLEFAEEALNQYDEIRNQYCPNKMPDVLDIVHFRATFREYVEKFFGGGDVGACLRNKCEGSK